VGSVVARQINSLTHEPRERLDGRERRGGACLHERQPALDHVVAVGDLLAHELFRARLELARQQLHELVLHVLWSPAPQHRHRRQHRCEWCAGASGAGARMCVATLSLLTTCTAQYRLRRLPATPSSHPNPPRRQTHTALRPSGGALLLPSCPPCDGMRVPPG
jgi:hypothetical protein